MKSTLRIISTLAFAFLLAPQTLVAEEIVVDNSDASFSIVSGTWVNSSNVTGFIGSDYLHDGNVQGGSEVSWPLSVSSPTDSYAVYARWTSAANRSSISTYTVNHSGGSTAVVTDQTVGGGTWILLGNFVGPTSVSLSNSGANGYVTADAVRAVGGPEITPPAPGPVNFGPAKGSDMWTAYQAQLGLYAPHTDICDTVTEVFVEVGNSGLGLCMEKNERAAEKWESARETCARDGKRLPETGEWKYACENVSGFLNLTNNYEWSSNTPLILDIAEVFQGLAVPVIGFGSCNNAGWRFIGRAKPSADDEFSEFRCVR